MKSCQLCKWLSVAADQQRECQYPLPEWLLRELHHPLTGGGALVRVVHEEYGQQCPTYEEAT